MDKGKQQKIMDKGKQQKIMDKGIIKHKQFDKGI